MKFKKDPRDVVYNYGGVNYVGSYDSKGNFHPPCRPPERPKKSGCSCERKDETSAEIDRLKTLVSELENKVEELAKKSDDNYEEPKKYWFIDTFNKCVCSEWTEDWEDDREQYNELIGNYFETKEEAEQAVEKLKAYKRLKDKGFSFEGYDDGYKHDFNSGHIEFYIKNDGDVLNDLDLLFGGEE